MFFIEAFFKSVIHGIDGGFAIVVALHGVEILFLDEKEQEKKTCEGCNDNNLENGKATFIHSYYYNIFLQSKNPKRVWIIWWYRVGLNHRPWAYESHALTS